MKARLRIVLAALLTAAFITITLQAQASSSTTTTTAPPWTLTTTSTTTTGTPPAPPQTAPPRQPPSKEELCALDTEWYLASLDECEEEGVTTTTVVSDEERPTLPRTGAQHGLLVGVGLGAVIGGTVAVRKGRQ